MLQRANSGRVLATDGPLASRWLEARAHLGKFFRLLSVLRGRIAQVGTIATLKQEPPKSRAASDRKVSNPRKATLLLQSPKDIFDSRLIET